jgi:DNA-binding HxlR family transcriptional regulator
MSVVPPHVEYDLTKPGKGMTPILHAMADWGLKNR